MFIITLKGSDVYLAGEIEKNLTPKISKLCRINENEIILHAVDGFIYHDGIEQTSYNLIVKIECSRELEKFENELVKLFFEVLKNYSVHTRIYFDYFTERKVYENINKDYPLFINSTNMVDVETDKFDEIDENVEIYDGNIFKDYENILPVDDEKK